MSRWIEIYERREMPAPESQMNWREIEITRRTIEDRQKVLRQEIKVREDELHNLDVEWDRTCDHADRLFDTRLRHGR